MVFSDPGVASPWIGYSTGTARCRSGTAAWFGCGSGAASRDAWAVWPNQLLPCSAPSTPSMHKFSSVSAVRSLEYLIVEVRGRVQFLNVRRAVQPSVVLSPKQRKFTRLETKMLCIRPACLQKQSYTRSVTLRIVQVEQTETEWIQTVSETYGRLTANKKAKRPYMQLESGWSVRERERERKRERERERESARRI